MPIGNRLKEARIQRGLTQEELARAVGVTKGAIGNYETGVSSPKESVLIKLMQVLEIDANYIYQDFITPHKDRITPEEARVLVAYRAAEATYRKVALELLETHPASTPARQTLA